MIIDLSHSMQERVREWRRRGNQLDLTLLLQCAYYPRGGCQDCSWDAPRGDCKWAHILVDTRIFTPKSEPSKKKGKLVDFEGLLSRLPVEIQREIRKIIEEGR